MLLFVLCLEPDNNEGQLVSFMTEPLNLKHHAAYIRPPLQMEDGGELATHAQAGPALPQFQGLFGQPKHIFSCLIH